MKFVIFSLIDHIYLLPLPPLKPIWVCMIKWLGWDVESSGEKIKGILIGGNRDGAIRGNVKKLQSKSMRDKDRYYKVLWITVDAGHRPFLQL